MATALLVVIYIAFIGLGIPDSLFGTAWPVLYVEFNLPLSMASCVTLLTCAGTIVSSLQSARLINRFGTGLVTAVSTAMTALALLGFSFSNSIVWLCLFAIPLGLGAGAIDTALNNYVALHYKAIHMSFLHCFYGIGVTLSPFLMSLTLLGPAGWRGGYRWAFGLQAVITAITFLSLPLWRKLHEQEVASGEATPAKTLSLSALARMPAVRMVWLVFLGSCAVEVTCGSWGSTFLVQARGMAADKAARIVMLYYMGMAVGRFLSGVLAGRLTPWQLVHLGQGTVLLAIVLLMLPLPAAVAGAGMFLAGLGIGPVFPNMTHLTPRTFGKDVSQSVIGSQMAASYVGIMVMPPLFGLLAQAVGAWALPYFLLVMFLVMTLATLRLVKLTGKK